MQSLNSDLWENDPHKSESTPKLTNGGGHNKKLGFSNLPKSINTPKFIMGLKVHHRRARLSCNHTHIFKAYMII